MMSTSGQLNSVEQIKYVSNQTTAIIISNANTLNTYSLTSLRDPKDIDLWTVGWVKPYTWRCVIKVPETTLQIVCRARGSKSKTLEALQSRESSDSPSE